MNINFTISNKITTNYLYMPTNTFYDNEEIYINIEGFIKKQQKLFLKIVLKVLNRF